MISLKKHQKRKVNTNDENYESDNVSGKRMRNSDDDEPSIFNCVFAIIKIKNIKFQKSKFKLDLDEMRRHAQNF